MIILAAAVVTTLSNSGIINRANEGVAAWDLNQVQHIATLAWAEAYLDGETNIDEEYIRGKLEEQGINTDNYDITVTANGVSVAKSKIPLDWKASVREITEDGVPIPIGFVASPYGASENYPAENTKAGGLVIYALTEDEIKDGVTDIVAIDGQDGTLTEEQAHYESLIKRNQFVWVPVDSNNFKDLFVRSKHGASYPNISPTLGTSGAWELVLTADNMVSQDTTNDNISSYVSETMLAEATAMYESVKKYGGFYIARYEVGTNSTFEDGKFGYIATRVSISGNTHTNLSVTMGKYPYVAVAWGTSMSDETSDDRAVSLARAFYPSTGTTYGVVSTLTYGVQWDRTLAWWEEQDALDGEDNLNLNNSTSYGVYAKTIITNADLNTGAKYSVLDSNNNFSTWRSITEKTSEGGWLLTTGAYKKANMYNIYDMAGNLEEWTMEGTFTWDGIRIIRGGVFYDGWRTDTVVDRLLTNPPGNHYVGDGFRPSLYIK